MKLACVENTENLEFSKGKNLNERKNSEITITLTIMRLVTEKFDF